mgnify:CR=1 FL=1|jgi:hypothetical protein
MRLVSTRQAIQLTELSTEQLREWTTRRALIPADVQSRGRGAPAQYAWQTLLVLRLAVALRERFHIELEHHRAVFAGLRAELEKTSFVSLWGRALVIYDADRWALIPIGETTGEAEQAIVAPLNAHLAVLSQGLPLPRPAAEGQLELFPVTAVGARPVGGARPMIDEIPHPQANWRRA